MASRGTVVFVCEHGSAKSIIAAAHFNRLARERQLDWHAIGRGTDPEATIPPHVLQGLHGDGLTPDGKPERLAPSDLATAARVVAFCDLPDEYHILVPVERWTDVPPVSQDYALARDVIAHHVSALLETLTHRQEDQE